jgi:hypothetical protein
VGGVWVIFLHGIQSQPINCLIVTRTIMLAKNVLKEEMKECNDDQEEDGCNED